MARYPHFPDLQLILQFKSSKLGIQSLAKRILSIASTLWLSTKVVVDATDQIEQRLMRLANIGSTVDFSLGLFLAF